jgi:signal transduction histidine kinase
LFVPAKRLPALYLLCGGVVIYAIADFAFGHGWSILAGYQTYAPGSPVIGGWILAIAFFGAGALHPSMALLSEPAFAPKAKLTYGRLVLLTGAALMVPGVMVVQAIVGQPIDVPLVAGGSVVLFLLVAARLAGMIAERTRAEEEIKEANRRLQELAVLKADFTRMVAHEFGGPLGAVRRLTEMLSAEGSDPGIRSYATATIEGEIDTLDILVADVRSAGEVERDDFRVALRPVPLAALLRNAEAYAENLPGDHPVEFVFDDDLDKDARVRADPERVGQVLRNLLSNAAEYSPAGAPIEVPVVRDRGEVRVEVVDRGTGIPPEDLVRIFEKFARGGNQKYRKAAGVGLGLYLSRRIIRSHGSELRASSAPGKGSVFVFELELVG